MDPISAGAVHLSALAGQLRREAARDAALGRDARALDGAASAAELASGAVLLTVQALTQERERADRERARGLRWAVFGSAVSGAVGGLLGALVGG